ncbi:MAG: hypothetical protein ABI723_05870 [Bacteroidia bacterium]
MNNPSHDFIRRQNFSLALPDMIQNMFSRKICSLPFASCLLPFASCQLKILVITFTFTFTFTYSQSIKFSPTEISERGFDYAKVVGQDDDGVFVLLSNFPHQSTRDKVGFKVRKYKVAYYDFNLQRKWSVAVQPGPSQTIDNIAFACGKVLIVYSREKESNHYEYYLQWINNRGVPQGGNNKNFELTFQRGSDYGKAEVTASTDKERIVIMLHEITNNNHQLFHCTTTDSTLQFGKTKVIDVPYKVDYFEADEFDVSNNGDVALSGVFTPQEKHNKNKLFDGDFWIYLLTADKETADVHEFKLSDKTINECSIAFDNLNNKLAVTGFYFDREATIGSGVAYQLYDLKDGTRTEVFSRGFEPSKDEELKGARNSDDGNGLMNYTINKIIMKADGGAVVVAESFYTTEYSYFDYFTQSYYRRTEYHYGNILVISIKNKGEIEFTKLVKKKQESIDDGGIYSSYLSMVSEKALYLFYNRDINSNNEIAGVSINAKGERTDKNVIRNVEHIWIMPDNGKQVSADETIVPCIQKKKLVLAKISLQ